jgi:hypothetical protein
MELGLMILEFIITTAVSIVVLYTTVIHYKLSISAIIGVNVLVGVLISAIHHFTTTSAATPMSILTGTSNGTIVAEGIAFFAVAIGSLIATFVILMSRFSFLTTIGILIVQGISCALLNVLLGLNRPVLKANPTPRNPVKH